MLLERERNYGLAMDALVIVCSWNRNTNVIMVWAWAHWPSCSLGTRVLSWFGHGAYGLGMDALVIALSKTRMLFCLGHGCAGHRMQKYWPVWDFSSGFNQRNRRKNPAPKAELRGKGKITGLPEIPSTCNMSTLKIPSALVPSTGGNQPYSNYLH